jgi:uncharacterized membrane protein
MYPPVTSPTLGLFALVLFVIFVLVEIGIIETAYERLGLSHRAVSLLLLGMIVGSYINIPIAAVPAQRIVQDQIITYFGMPYVVPRIVDEGRTVIAINVGGALIPVAVCVYLLARWGRVLKSLIATAVVSVIVYRLSSVVPGVGIAVPTIVPGVVAAMMAWLMDRFRASSIAYVAGTLGCLLGADIFNLPLIHELRAPVAAIGGAGTFDGVFVSGIIAVLLA